MGALRPGLPALVLLVANQTALAANPSAPRTNAVPSQAAPAPDTVARWRREIDEAAARFSVPAVWIEHVIRAESNGLTIWKGVPITSRAGAMGLMQLMPATWAAMRATLRLGDNPHDPRDNILAGTAYLRAMYDRFGYPGLFAAYNAGPGRYTAHLVSGSPLPAETRSYIAKVAGVELWRDMPQVAPETAPRQGLFVALRGEENVPSAAPAARPKDRTDNLFVVRNVP